MKSDQIANAARLLSAAFGFASQPGLKSSLSLYDTAKKVLKSSPPSIRGLADEAEKIAQKVFDEWKRGVPPDADVRISQMVEATLPDHAMLVAHGKDPDRIAVAMRAGLSDPDHLVAPMPEVFEQIMASVLAPLCKSKTVGKELTEAYLQRILGDMAEDRADRTRRFDQVDARLEGIEAIVKGQFVPLDRLQALARAFGQEDLAGRDALEAFLFARAQNYLDAQNKLSLIKDTTLRAAELKARAEEEMTNGDINAAPDMLSEAHALELEAARATADVRIDLAMSEGAVEVVYQHAQAIAESFGSTDPQAPARIKVIDYAPRLIAAAEHYDLNGTVFAFALIEPCLGEKTKATDPELWAAAQHLYGHVSAIAALNAPSDTGFYAQAIAAFDSAHSIRTQEVYPDLWARTELERIRLIVASAIVADEDTALQDATNRLKAFKPFAQTPGNETLFASSLIESGKLLLHIAQKLSDLARAQHVFAAAEKSFDDAAAHFEFRDPETFASIQLNRARTKSFLAMFEPPETAGVRIDAASDLMLETSLYYARTAQPVRRIETLLTLSATTMQLVAAGASAIPRETLIRALDILDLAREALRSNPLPDLVELEAMVRRDLTEFLSMA